MKLKTEILACKFYLVEENIFNSIDSDGNYDEVLAGIKKATVENGKYIDEFPIFQLEDLFDSLTAFDQNVFGRNFFGILLTCISPLELLDKFNSSETKLGYISSEIVTDFKKLISDKLSEDYNSNEQDTYSSLCRAIIKSVLTVNEQSTSIIVLYDYEPIKTVSEAELSNKDKSVLRIFNRFRKQR